MNKMDNDRSKRVCLVERAGGLDNRIRRFLQNPQKILKPYIRSGMTVLDLGCGPGFFSAAMARMLGDSGKVIAADLQPGMLEKVRQKIKGTILEQRIRLHQCRQDSIDLDEKVDFVLAFYMVHEVPDHDKLFHELKTILKAGGFLFIIEPKFHVSKASFDSMVDRIQTMGFEIIDKPKVFLSRTVVVRNKA